MDFTDEEIISMFGGIKPLPATAAAHETRHNSLLRQINEIPEEPATEQQQNVTRK
jgi:hypothetical protein